MTIQVSGFAETLTRCLDFEGVAPEELELVLAEAALPLEMRFAEPSAEIPLIRSGSDFTHLVFVQHGVVTPWQSPYSELAAPFLIGVHEFLMGSERWSASYSAITEAVVVRIPSEVMGHVVERFPSVRERMQELVMRRLARFYWVSLATSGGPASRVAAALVSRLALVDLDYGADRAIAIRQKDLVRLTTLSRSAVAAGLSELAATAAIRWGDGPGARFKGEVIVPDVDALKDQAFADVRARELRPLLSVSNDE